MRGGNVEEVGAAAAVLGGGWLGCGLVGRGDEEMELNGEAEDSS